jgi:hypothetical protein
MGISKQTYRKIKLAYRHGGMTRSMPCYEGASELTRFLRLAKVQIWICTSRPYLKMDHVDVDSRHWLRKNGIKYDHLLYGDRKYYDLAKQAGPENVVCVLDDLTEMYAQAEKARLEPLLIERPHNQFRPDNPKLNSVNDLWDARYSIVEMIHRARGSRQT